MQKEKVGVGAYVSLFLAISLFSGVFYKMPEGWTWLSAFDFTTLIGKFGTVFESINFVGKGGVSARQAFVFALSLVPGVMLALGLLEVLSHYGALRAAQQLMTPLLRPILGVPGNTGLALITDLQSTDAGAALTKVSVVTRQDRFIPLQNALEQIGVTGLTVTNVFGYGQQKGHEAFFRGVPVEARLLPKLKVEVVVSKVPVDAVVEAARKALYTGHVGDGKIFVYDVENVVKVRTGEQGYDALQDAD